MENLALILRRLSPSFAYLERNKLCYGLGARTVHNYPFYTVAFFANVQACQMVIRLLHQRMVHGQRIKVEYWNNRPDKGQRLNAHCPLDAALKSQIRKEQSNANRKIETLQDELWNFPDATPSTVLRMARQMLLDGRFYRQVLGLMVKLKLPPPFDNDNPNDCPEDFFSLKAKRSHQELSEDDDDSEIETTFESSDTRHHMTNSMVNKRIKLSTGLVGEKAKNYVSKPKTVPNEKRAATTTIEELFECNTLSIPKKQHHEINLKHLDIDTPVLQPELQTSESFGQIHPIVEEGKKEPKTDDNKQSILAQIKDADLVSDAELEQNRISESQQNEWPAFKNYQPGNPSQRLYIKNLHAKVTQLDLYRLFLKFIVLPDHLDSFDIVHMTKGRLRGQAFVTFPSIEIAERALQSTNGYMLQSRPMVVMFGRNAN